MKSASFRLVTLHVVFGANAVTVAVPAAVRIGLDVLRAGGNAFDAVVAACVMETVWLPMKCGLAGDLVALVLERIATMRRLNERVAYLSNDALPIAGSPLRLLGLAQILRVFAKTGGDLFRGEIGQGVVGRLKSAGGILEESDFHQDPAECREPVRINLAESGILLVSPFPTHGVLLSKAVEFLTISDSSTLEAFREARSNFTQAGGSGTSVVVASDHDGNTVVVVHSEFFPRYESCVVVEELDLVLNNRPGRGISLDELADHCNAPKAGDRPFTTLHAWTLRGTTPWWLGATPGGANQVPWSLQVISDWLAGEHDLAQLVTYPRWSFDSREKFRSKKATQIHRTLDARIIPALSQRSAEQFLRLPIGGGRKCAAADPRTGAKALAVD